MQHVCFSRLAFASSLALLSVMAPAAAAQGELVLTAGETLSNGDAVQFVRNYAVGNRGDWAADVQTDNPDASSSTMIVVNGEITLQRGQPIGGSPGFLAGIWRDVQVDERGRVMLRGQVTSPQGASLGAVVVDDEVVLLQGQVPVGASGNAIQSIQAATLGATGLVRAVVILEPGGFGAPGTLVEVDLASTAPTPTVVLGPGDVFPDQSVVDSVRDCWNTDGGDAMCRVIETTQGGAARTSVRFGDARLISTGDPAPFPGANWSLSTFQSAGVNFAGNDSGELAILGRITGTSNTQALAVDDRLIVRVGDVMDIDDGLSVLTQIDTMALELTENGRVAWFGYADGKPGFFLDQEPLIRQGLPAAGSVIETLFEFVAVELHPVSDNGLYVLHWVQLMDGRTGLLRRDLGIGTSVCGPAVTNSSGAAAAARATGYDIAGGEPLRLIASGLPQSTLGYFLVGSQQSISMPPASQGRLCLGGSIGRFSSVVLDAGLGGQFELAVDTRSLPVAAGIAIRPGDTWFFQAWIRDANPLPTSNFTDAVRLSFQ